MRSLRSALALLSIVIALTSSDLAAQPERATGSPWNDWSVLRLHARMGALGSGQFELRLSGDERKRIIETDARAKLVGVRVGRSRSLSILGRDGHTERYEGYSRNRGRRYRFDDEQYKVEKLKSDRGFEAPPGDWEAYFTTEHPYPTEDGRPLRPFDYYGMLLHLREVGLDRPGDTVELYVATTGGPQPYRIEVVEERTHERSWIDLATGRPRSEKTHELRLTVTPADPAHAEEGFLKMQGQTEIWVEAESKAPVEIAGRVPRVGHVRMKLEAMKSGSD
jgi:hypothetical protein